MTPEAPGESAPIPAHGKQQSVIRTRLAAARVSAGLTQKEMAWAVGIPVASYIRLERGKLSNPRLGWVVNASIVLGADFPDLLDDSMKAWYRFDRSGPPSESWYERPEVRERAERWRREEEG